jgi:predicted nucleic acid-binding protein
MKSVYLDSSCIIYLVEASSPFHEVAVTRVLQCKGATAMSSTLSRLECRVKPLRAGNDALLARYDAFFGQEDLDLVDMDRRIVDRATALRARYMLSTPDALHVATAIEKHAEVIITGDSDLTRCPEIQVELLTGVQIT